MATKSTNQQTNKSTNPRIKRIKRGLALHVHHSNFLFEYCYDYDGRREQIKLIKPKDEQPKRLRLFKLIPLKLLPPDLCKAVKIANKKYNALKKMPAKEFEARKARIKVEWLAWRHRDYLKTLHSKICKDCPWDGRTIFPHRFD